MFGTVFTLASCEKASKSARVPSDKCEVRLIEDAATHDKTALVTLGIINDSIYNVNQVTFMYDVYDDESRIAQDQPAVVDLYIRHGVSGYLSYTVKVDKDSPATHVKITSTAVTGYWSFWDTYRVPFIVMFTIVGIALLVFGVEVFKGGITKESVKEALRERLYTSIVIFAMTLLLCLVPLMFSNWVVTCILLGGFIGAGLLCGVMTLIRMATLK